MSQEKPKSASACVVCGEPVTTHKYAQILPLVAAGDDEKGPHVVEAGGRRLKVPAYDDPRRLAGKRFVCLAHEVDEITEALELDPDAVYELRHRPARKVVRLSFDNFAKLDPRNAIAELSDGRKVAFLRIVAGKAEVDYGVLLKCRCFGRQAAECLADWRQKLMETALV